MSYSLETFWKGRFLFFRHFPFYINVEWCRKINKLSKIQSWRFFQGSDHFLIVKKPKKSTWSALPPLQVSVLARNRTAPGSTLRITSNLFTSIGYRYDDPWCTFLFFRWKKQSSAKVGAIGSTFGKSEGEDVHDDGKWDDNRRLKEVIQ